MCQTPALGFAGDREKESVREGDTADGPSSQRIGQLAQSMTRKKQRIACAQG